MKTVACKLSIAVADIDVMQAEKWAGELNKLIDEMEETGT